MTKTKNTYSFSRITSWKTCKYGWFLNYEKKNRGEDNFFNTFGTLGHDVLEKVDRKKITPAQAFQEWESRYDKEVVGITHKWMNNWKSDADRFFQDFKGWKTEAVWIEEHVFVERPNYTFQGFVDRMGRTKSGDLIMTDYKCAKPYTGATLKEKARQMYLYAQAVKEKFGEYPSKLIFFHFRQNHPQIIPFKMEDLEEAWAWADKMVAEIETYEGNFPMTDNGYFCEAVCGFRNTCTKQFEG
jgi:RecB family exonuclease